jgi:hypothetical protein
LKDESLFSFRRCKCCVNLLFLWNIMGAFLRWFRFINEYYVMLFLFLMRFMSVLLLLFLILFVITQLKALLLAIILLIRRLIWFWVPCIISRLIKRTFVHVIRCSNLPSRWDLKSFKMQRLLLYIYWRVHSKRGHNGILVKNVSFVCFRMKPYHTVLFSEHLLMQGNEHLVF